MILAVKYWDDRVMVNSQIVDKLKVFDIKATNKFENLFLQLIGFKLKVDNELFDHYYKWLVVYNQFVNTSIK